MQYLKEHRPGIHSQLLLSGQLNKDIQIADVQAHYLPDTVITQMTKEAGVIEQLKMTDQLRCCGMMNAIIVQVKEIIRNVIVDK